MGQCFYLCGLILPNAGWFKRHRDGGSGLCATQFTPLDMFQSSWSILAGEIQPQDGHSNRSNHNVRLYFPGNLYEHLVELCDTLLPLFSCRHWSSLLGATDVQLGMVPKLKRACNWANCWRIWVWSFYFWLYIYCHCQPRQLDALSAWGWIIHRQTISRLCGWASALYVQGMLLYMDSAWTTSCSGSFKEPLLRTERNHKNAARYNIALFYRIKFEWRRAR